MAQISEDDNLSIFIDQPEIQNIVLDFPNYAKTISNIILHSTPQFTVGIFGEWGTGKTTLMKSIAGILTSNNCNILEFNAWRYEGEERSATFPLMLEILGTLLNFVPIDEYLRKQPPRTKATIRGKLSRVLSGLSGSVGANFGVVQAQLNVDPSKMKSETKKMSIGKIWKFYDETKPLLQEGVDLIQLSSSIAPSHNNKSELKLVIFIDDLDRCTPEKACEVFESIKVFFDLKGLIFVLGLSRSIVEAAIDVKYKDFQKTFSGSDYIKKIIQVPFTLPVWKKEDIEKYIVSLIKSHTNLQYRNFFNQNKEIISEGVANNPREVKRLLNNFIMSNAIYANEPKIKKEILLVMQVISMRWKWFYDYVLDYPKIIVAVETVLYPLSSDDIHLENSGSDTKNISEKYKEIIQKLHGDLSLKNFLLGNGKIFFDLNENNLMIYRRATSIEQKFEEFDKTSQKWWEELKNEEEIEKRVIEENQQREQDIKENLVFKELTNFEAN